MRYTDFIIIAAILNDPVFSTDVNMREVNLLSSKLYWWYMRMRSTSIFLASSTAAASPHPFGILTFASAVLMIISFSKGYTIRYAVCLFIHLKCSFLFLPT